MIQAFVCQSCRVLPTASVVDVIDDHRGIPHELPQPGQQILRPGLEEESPANRSGRDGESIQHPSESTRRYPVDRCDSSEGRHVPSRDRVQLDVGRAAPREAQQQVARRIESPRRQDTVAVIEGPFNRDTG